MNNKIVTQFIEKEASKLSLSKRKLLFGIGINDANYTTQPMINGKQIICPYYKVWRDMLRRCYDKKYHQKQPTYRWCSVTKDWLTFSNFKKWMIKQDWQSKALDKDIINKDNKIYSSESCCFVSHSINSILNENKTRRGKYPQGVSYHKGYNNFVSHCGKDGKAKHLGYFNTVEQAELAYKKFKSNLIKEIANMQPENIKKGLYRHAEVLLNA